MNPLILGVGTGRCGTKSLVRLLDGQPSVRATHERYGHHIRWACPPNLWPLRLWRETARAEGPRISADVALNWTPHVRTFLEWADDAERTVQVVGLKRDRGEVVSSYKRWKQDANHWGFHGDRGAPPDKWDHCYPPEELVATKGEAIGAFWDRVYGILEPIAREDHRVEIFETGDLNTEEGVRQILDHCGVEDPNVEVGIRIKAPTIEDARNSTQWQKTT